MNRTVTKRAPSDTAETNGQALYYEVHGDRQALVLLMGIGYDSSLWTLAQVPAFPIQFRVVLVDNRDAGCSSEASRPYNIADMAYDLAGVLDVLGIPSTHMVGPYMGGMIALEFALQHAHRLDRLVLAGTEASPAQSAVARSTSGAVSRPMTRLGGVWQPTARFAVLCGFSPEPRGGPGHCRFDGQHPMDPAAYWR